MRSAQALLQEDFGLQWDMPRDRLCPTVPQKLNYICWLEDLIALRPAAAGAAAAAPASVSAIDIGTGASCIYALLGAARGWSVVATEVDEKSMASATANVERNSLQVRSM